MLERMDEGGGPQRPAGEPAAFPRGATQDFLRRVGIAPGMRVLDVAGDVEEVALLAAEIVGPSGEIIGVDANETTISAAAARAQAQGVTNVRFLQRDVDHLADLASDRPFDAVVSRRGMLYRANPTETIRDLIGLVRPCGLLGFQDVDLGMRYWSTQKLDALEQLYDCIDRLAERNRISKDLGIAFSKAFNVARIADRRIIRTGAAESASDAGVYARVGAFARLLIDVGDPEVRPADFGQSFEAQLKHEAESKGAVFIPFYFLGAAGRSPDPSTDAANKN